MSVDFFCDVVRVYKKSSSCSITRHRIPHPAFGNFCVCLYKFNSMLGELAYDIYWKNYLTPLKRLRFDLCAAPFNKEYLNERITRTVANLQTHLLLCTKLYPDYAVDANLILDLLTELLNDPANPLLDKLIELTTTKQSTAWVVKESRLIPRVEEDISLLKLPDLRIIHPSQLSKLTCYDKLIILGPSRWFPESVFISPRASHIDILIYDWIKDRWKPKNSFVNPYKSSGSSKESRVVFEERETSSKWDDINPEDIFNIMDRNVSVVSRQINAYQENIDDNENVEAICVFLEDDWAVLIDSSEGTTTLVIDPEEDHDNRINRILVKEIRPSMYILVRTSGGGDYIIPVADRILGNLAHSARQRQKHWKELLRSYVKRHGLSKTCNDLISYGSKIANEINVHNWMSPRSIRTHKYSDFLAIMKLVGLENDATECWATMEKINTAHHKAGVHIRKLLLNQVKDVDIELLQKQGKMDFKLSSSDEGGLTAYRVESILAESLEVPYSRIGHLFKLDN